MSIMRLTLGTLVVLVAVKTLLISITRSSNAEHQSLEAITSCRQSRCRVRPRSPRSEVFFNRSGGMASLVLYTTYLCLRVLEAWANSNVTVTMAAGAG